jgi:DeoR family transcriptional regulator of aga operon
MVVGTDDFLSRRSIRNVDNKKTIVMKAKEMINPGTSVFLDSGSTTTMLAAELDDQPNLIVTSSISCAMELSGLEKPKVLIPGGTMNRYSLSICGPQGIRELQKMNFDQAFIGVTTFDEGSGFACNVYEESLLKQTVISKAHRTIVLMDSTKVGKHSTFTFGSLKDVDVVISDGYLPEPFLAACRENDVEVL